MDVETPLEDGGLTIRNMVMTTDDHTIIIAQLLKEPRSRKT